MRRRPAGEARAFLEEHLACEPADICMLWPYNTNPDGYGKIRIGARTVAVHVFVCERIHGDRPAGMDAAHECGTPSCFNPRHLKWKSHTENIADKWRHGTMARGERQGSAKLTADEVTKIRSTWTSGVASREGLAATYGVSTSAINRILARRTWRHLP